MKWVHRAHGGCGARKGIEQRGQSKSVYRARVVLAEVIFRAAGSNDADELGSFCIFYPTLSLSLSLYCSFYQIFFSNTHGACNVDFYHCLRLLTADLYCFLLDIHQPFAKKAQLLHLPLLYFSLLCFLAMLEFLIAVLFAIGPNTL